MVPLPIRSSAERPPTRTAGYAFTEASSPQFKSLAPSSLFLALRLRLPRQFLQVQVLWQRWLEAGQVGVVQQRLVKDLAPVRPRVTRVHFVPAEPKVVGRPLAAKDAGPRVVGRVRVDDVIGQLARDVELSGWSREGCERLGRRRQWRRRRRQKGGG